MSFVFDPPPQPSVPVKGSGDFPVRRVFCIGRNYAEHVREMGGDPKEASPVFFTKPADAIALNGSAIPYPPATDNLHFEGELVVALGSGGADIDVSDASSHVFGYAAGCDLTRRDHQAKAKKTGGPWDSAKAFDRSAPVGDILPADEAGDLFNSQLVTIVNRKTLQDSLLSRMLWTVPEIISALSRQFELKAGDLIFTGTPEGVGPLTIGDKVEVRIGHLPALTFFVRVGQ